MSIAERFAQACRVDDGRTHKAHAESRDLLLAIIDDHPEVFDSNLNVVRAAAERCSHVGPFDKAIELFRKLAPLSNNAGDYFKLSEVLTRGDYHEEAVAALAKAIELNSAYGTVANKETLGLARSSQSKRKIGRYPETKDFTGDLKRLIKSHIAVNLSHEPRFVGPKTQFFTMGSCFARNLSRSLNKSGYASHHLEISEYINTTFANRMFVDWLNGEIIDAAVRDRIEELLPKGWSRANALYLIRSSQVFILTLGVAPAFFDRESGEFVLPRSTALNSRVLAEKYQFRTTTVAENVDNVLHLVNFVRKIAPDIKIVVTVSPVPLLASFEHESAVQADCLSKSTMRLVAHEIVNNSGLSNIIYWPSFEVFRWAGSHASDFYAADDGAAWHVSENKVEETIAAFLEMFSQ